jgi:hypothetical protein
MNPTLTGKPIPLELLKQLVNENAHTERQKRKYPIPEQYGPLRRFDRELRCASRGCGSPTYYKVDGIPYCTVHALRQLNDLVMVLTKRIEDGYRGSYKRSWKMEDDAQV